MVDQCGDLLNTPFIRSVNNKFPLVMLLLCCYLCELVSEILHTTHFWLGLHYTMFILLKYQIPRGHVTNLHFYVFGELFSQQAMKSSKFNSGQHTGDLKLEKTTHLHNSCDIDTCTAVFKMVLSKEERLRAISMLEETIHDINCKIVTFSMSSSHLLERNTSSNRV